MSIKKRFLFSVLFVFVFVVFISTSVENERAGRVIADFKGLIHVNQYFKNEVDLHQNVMRTVNTMKANTSSSHFVHIKNGDVTRARTRTIKTMKANTSRNSSHFVHREEITTATVKPTTSSSSHFVHIKNEKITTVNTKKPTANNSSHFVHREITTATVKPTTSSSTHFVDIKNEKITTINTKKPTTNNSFRFVVLNKLNPGNHTLSTRQGKCADIICSNFLSTSEMYCAKAVAKMKSVTRVTPRCHFRNGTMKPRVLLRTFPGSGNTWTRELLEKTSGICTGN